MKPWGRGLQNDTPYGIAAVFKNSPEDIFWRYYFVSIEPL